MKMTKPMTWKEAWLKHACQQCLTDIGCDRDCALSCTCSLPCPECNRRNYWTGDLPGRRGEREFTCVHCQSMVQR